MSELMVERVREKYAGVARSGLGNDSADFAAVAAAFGYTPEELAALPAEANMGLSCGNPTATAHLQPGETVVDLGCGGGIDVLLAAKQVGPRGKAVGIDMTPEMIGRANANAIKAGVANAEFHLARLEALPLADATADAIISNCVINLVPDKPAVFREMYRVLKPGGRVAVSDIALKRALPEELARSVAAYVGCIAGAVSFADYENLLRAAGFDAVQVVDAKKDLNAYAMVESASGCCGAGCASSELHADLAELVGRHDVNDYAASVRVFAVKPAPIGETASPAAGSTTTRLQVFDKPMCCATGICGPQVDPTLPRFASDLAWLKERGVTVERYNLAHEPQAFARHDDVKAALQAQDLDGLPLVRVDGRIVLSGAYPTRDQLARWCGLAAPAPAPALESAGAARCGSSGCC